MTDPTGMAIQRGSEGTEGGAVISRLGDRTISSTYRGAAKALERAQQRMERAQTDLFAHRAMLTEAAKRITEDFGLTVDQAANLTPFVLDIFDSCEPIEAEDALGFCWVWLGGRNNKNLPQLSAYGLTSTTRTYRSVAQVLAYCLDGADFGGILYPKCERGQDCVNFGHKTRRGTEVQHGSAVFTKIGDLT